MVVLVIAMRRSSRLFEIIQVLRSARAPMPAHAIATALEVNKRTVYRDIATLQAMRVPIVGEAGIGYVMRPGFDLPPLMFTADEIEAIVVGLALLGRTRDGGLERAADRVRQKLACVLPVQPGHAIDALPLHASTWSAVPPSVVETELIRSAIRDEQMVRLIYRDAADRVTTRVAWPLALTYWVDGVVLGAWCELRRDYRHFRLDRIVDCARTGAAFTGQGARLRAGWLNVARPAAMPQTSTSL